ncbi:MAG: hypothetical protein HC830_05735 [Bacteroidetes bacterium]|nr:hypothetical protein [Bacteroidota bacterium]
MQVTIEANGKPLVQYRFSEIDTAPSKAFIIMEGSTKPYIANLTGFDLPLFTLFSTSEGMWRDRKIFVTPQENMMMVGLAYPQDPDQSFAISRINDSLQLKQGDRLYKNLSKESVENYFMGVAGLTADRIGMERNEYTYEEIKNNIPFAELIIKNNNIALKHLKFIRYPIKPSQKHSILISLSV